MRGASFAVLCFRIAKCVRWSYERRIFHCTVFQNCQMCNVVLWEAHLLLYCFRIARCVGWSYERRIFHRTMVENCKSNCEVKSEKQQSDVPCGSPITRIMCRVKTIIYVWRCLGPAGANKNLHVRVSSVAFKAKTFKLCIMYQFPALIDLNEGLT